MIVSAGDLLLIKRGRPRTVLHVLETDWRMPTPPRADRTYRLNERGGRPDKAVTVTCVGVERHEDGGWRVTVRPGDARDLPRLLRAAPNTDPEFDKQHVRVHSEEGDYTSDPRKAMQDAGEAVPEGVQARYSHDAGERDELMRQQKIREARAMIRGGVEILAQQGSHAAKVAKTIKHHSDRLEDAA